MKSHLFLTLVGIAVLCISISEVQAQYRRVIRASELGENEGLNHSKKRETRNEDCDDTFQKKYAKDPVASLFLKDCKAFALNILNPMDHEQDNEKQPADKPYKIPPKDTPNRPEGTPAIFEFDKKISYSVYSLTEGKISSYFYLNTKNGWSIKDKKAMESIASEKLEGNLHSLLNAEQRKMMAFIKSREGAFFTEMNMEELNDSNYLEPSEDFFKFAKKTGETINSSRYPSIIEEYLYQFEGKNVYIFLSKTNDLKLNASTPASLIGFSGLGYLTDNKKNTYLIVALADNTSIIVMDAIENSQFTFNSTGYQGMNSLLASKLNGMSQLPAASSGADYFTQIEKQNQKNWQGFSQTNDILALGRGYDSPALTVEFFDMIIATMDNYILEINKSTAELAGNSSAEALRRRKENQCYLICYTAKKAVLENLKREFVGIQGNRRLSQEQKSTSEDDLFKRFGQNQAKPCDC